MAGMNSPSSSSASTILSDLPTELLCSIFLYLEYDDLSTGINLTCVKFHGILTSLKATNNRPLLEYLRFQPNPIPATVAEKLKRWNGRVFVNPIFNKLTYYCTDSISDVYIKPSANYYSQPPSTEPIRLIDSPFADENAIWPPVAHLAVKLGREITLILYKGARAPTVREVMQEIANWFVTDDRTERWCVYDPAEQFPTRVADWCWDWWYKWVGIGSEGGRDKFVPHKAEIEVKLKRVKVQWEE